MSVSELTAVVITVLGWGGATVSLVTYIMVTRQRLATNSVRYQALNVVGAGALGVSALANGALPSAVVNIIWIGIGVVAVLSMKRGVIAARLAAEARRRRRLAEEARARLTAGRDRLVHRVREDGSAPLARRTGALRDRPLQPGSSRPAGRNESRRRTRTTSHLA
ncbi:hypothetical protein GCM10009790_00420 [Georgenia ruanii]